MLSTRRQAYHAHCCMRAIHLSWRSCLQKTKFMRGSESCPTRHAACGRSSRPQRTGLCTRPSVWKIWSTIAPSGRDALL